MKHNDIINGLVLSIGKPEYSFPELVHLCKPFGISENSIRTFLSRSIQKGYYRVRKEGRRAYYLPGKKMNRITANVSYSFNVPDWSGWDNDWWGVSFSVPESDKPKRHQIRKILKHYRFAPQANGFWIRPQRQDDQIETALLKLRTDKDCRLISFSCVDPVSAEEAAVMWGLDRINTFYAEQIAELEKTDMSGKLSPPDALCRRIILGNRIIPMLAEDPLLPDGLLPSGWLGREIRTLYFKHDGWLEKQAKPYWNYK